MSEPIEAVRRHKHRRLRQFDSRSASNRDSGRDRISRGDPGACRSDDLVDQAVPAVHSDRRRARGRHCDDFLVGKEGRKINSCVEANLPATGQPNLSLRLGALNPMDLAQQLSRADFI